MKVQYRKALCYFGIVLTGLTVYGGITALWALTHPWDNLVWNNKAIQANATIATNDVRDFVGQDMTLYVGYITVTYHGYWAQLRAIEDDPLQVRVEKLLHDLFPINGTVTVYYQATQPSNPHLGPKPILNFLIWFLFAVVLFIGLVTAVSLIIYRDYVIHKLTYVEEESIRLYNRDDLKLGRHIYSK